MSFVVRSGTGTETTAVTPQPQATPIPANLADLEPGGPLPAAPQPVVHNSDTHIALNPTDKDLLKYLQKSKITTRNSVAAWISHYLLFGWWTTRKAEKHLKGQGIDTQKLSWRDTRWLAIQTMAAKEDNSEAVKNLLEDNKPSRQSQVNQALVSLLRDKGGLISQAALEHRDALPPNFLALFTNEETRNARLDTLLEKAAADPSVLQGLVKLAQDEGIGDAVANHVKELARANNQSALILWAATAYNDDAGLDGDFAALFAEDAPDRDDRLTTLLSVAHTNPDVHTTVIQLTKNDEIGGHIEEQVIAAADRHEPGAISICCQLVGESSYQQYARNMAELERLLAPPNGPPEEGAAARLTDLSNRTQNQTKLLELAKDPAVVEILVQILSSSTAEQRDLQKGAILALAPRLIGGDDERVLTAISRLLASADPEEKVLLFRLAQEIPDLVTVLNKAITKHLQDHPEGREAIQAKLATMLNQQSPVLRGLIARGNALALEVLREAAVHNKPKALTELLAMLTANPPIAAAGPILQAAVQGGSKSALTILTHAASKGSEIALGILCYLAPTNEEATLDLCEVAKKHPVEVMPKLRQLADQGNAGSFSKIPRNRRAHCHHKTS